MLHDSPLPKGYKQTEVGVIPEDWEVKPTKGMISISHGFAFEGRYFANSGSLYRLTTPGHFYEAGGFREIGEKQKFYVGEIPSDYVFQSGDLIVAMTEQADGLLGSTAFIPGEGYLHNQRIGRIRALSPAIDLSYLFFVFNSLSYRAKVCETAAGTKVKHTSPEKLMEISIPLPPLPEQRAIATALADVDALLGGLDRLIAKKRDLKQAAMQQLLTGKTRLPGFGERKGYKQTEVGEIPEDWDISTLNSVSSVPMQNGVFYKPSHKGTGVKLINVGDLYGQTPINHEGLELFAANDDEKRRFRVENGDLFFTRSSVVPSGIAHCNIYVSNRDEEVLFDSHVIRVRPDEQKIDSGYLFRYCVSSVARKYLVSHAKTGTMTTIDQGVLGKCPVLLPRLTEQTAIATILSDMDSEIAALEQRRDKTRALKQAMMQELLTGRIRLV